MSDEIKIQAELRSIRERAGLTQARLAERLGCSTKRITNIEGGSRRPSLELIGRWAEACGRRYVHSFVSAEVDEAAVEQTVAALRGAPAEALRVVATLLVQVEESGSTGLEALESHVAAWRRSIQASPRRGGP